MSTNNRQPTTSFSLGSIYQTPRSIHSRRTKYGDFRVDVNDETRKASQTPRSMHSLGASHATREFHVKPWLCGEPYNTKVPSTHDNWDTCVQSLKDYDGDLCGAWKDEVEKLLILAGLFAGTVTAFVTQSYQYLLPDQPDENTILLAQILSQLQLQNQNSTSQFLSASQPAGSLPPQEAIQINALWFTSLIILLGTVVLGVLCLQWLREYDRNIPLDPQDALAIRQIRHEGLVAWKVPEILNLLPILLITSLVLFFGGLLVLLWSLNHPVALSLSVLVALFCTIFFITTVGPALYLFIGTNAFFKMTQCPWKSPQAWLAHKIVVLFMMPIDFLLRASTRGSLFGFSKMSRCRDWLGYDVGWLSMRNYPLSPLERREDTGRALGWVDTNLAQSLDQSLAVYHCSNEADIPSFLPEWAFDPRRHWDEQLELWKESLTKEERREFRATRWLWLRSMIFPQLHDRYCESLARSLNSWLVRFLNQARRLGNAVDRPKINPLHQLHPFFFDAFDVIAECAKAPDIKTVPRDFIQQLLQCIEVLLRQVPDLFFHPPSKQLWDPVSGLVGEFLELMNALLSDDHNAPEDVELAEAAVRVARLLLWRPVSELYVGNIDQKDADYRWFEKRLRALEDKLQSH